MSTQHPNPTIADMQRTVFDAVLATLEEPPLNLPPNVAQKVRTVWAALEAVSPTVPVPQLDVHRTCVSLEWSRPTHYADVLVYLDTGLIEAFYRRRVGVKDYDGESDVEALSPAFIRRLVEVLQ